MNVQGKTLITMNIVEKRKQKNLRIIIAVWKYDIKKNGYIDKSYIINILSKTRS